MFTGTALESSPPLVMDLSKSGSVTAARFWYTSPICRLSSLEIRPPVETPSMNNPRLRLATCHQSKPKRVGFVVIEGSGAFHSWLSVRVATQPLKASIHNQCSINYLNRWMFLRYCCESHMLFYMLLSIMVQKHLPQRDKFYFANIFPVAAVQFNSTPINDRTPIQIYAFLFTNICVAISFCPKAYQNWRTNPFWLISDTSMNIVSFCLWRARFYKR